MDCPTCKTLMIEDNDSKYCDGCGRIECNTCGRVYYSLDELDKVDASDLEHSTTDYECPECETVVYSIDWY